MTRTRYHAYMVAVTLAVILVIGGCTAATVGYAQVERVRFTLTSKESVASGSGHEYRLYTTAGTFVVGDSLLHPRFNSADIYGRLKAGVTYDCKVYGARIGLLSSFKNVISCNPITKEN